MARMQIIRQTGGVWNSQPIISPLNGSQEQRIKQQIASPGWFHLQAIQSTCLQPLLMTDQLSIPGAIPRISQIPLQPLQ